MVMKMRLTDGGGRLTDEGQTRLSKNIDILSTALNVSIPFSYSILFVECLMIPICRLVDISKGIECQYSHGKNRCINSNSEERPGSQLTSSWMAL